MAFIFPSIGNVIIPTDELHFQRGRSTTNQFRKVITLWNWHLRNWPLWKLRDRIYHQFGWPKSRLHSKPNIFLLVNHSNPQDYLRAAAPAADPGKNTRRFVTQHSFLFFFFCVDQIQQYGHQLWWRWLFGCHLTQLSGTQFFQTHKTLSHTILDGISHMFG